MKRDHFPQLITSLPQFTGPFDAFKLGANGCDVLFASYPAGTKVEPHDHPTENCGVITAGELILIVDGEEARYSVGQWYYLKPGQTHAARFEIETSEVEFWFDASGEPAV